MLPTVKLLLYFSMYLMVERIACVPSSSPLCESDAMPLVATVHVMLLVDLLFSMIHAAVIPLLFNFGVCKLPHTDIRVPLSNT